MFCFFPSPSFRLLLDLLFGFFSIYFSRFPSADIGVQRGEAGLCMYVRMCDFNEARRKQQRKQEEENRGKKAEEKKRFRESESVLIE